MAVYSGSRYVTTPLYYPKEGTALLSIRNRGIFNSEDAIYYTFLQKDTIDGIAFRHYNNAQLGWAILDCNPQYQSELDIKPGDTLLIPSYEEVVHMIG